MGDPGPAAGEHDRDGDHRPDDPDHVGLGEAHAERVVLIHQDEERDRQGNELDPGHGHVAPQLHPAAQHADHALVEHQRRARKTGADYEERRLADRPPDSGKVPVVAEVQPDDHREDEPEDGRPGTGRCYRGGKQPAAIALPLRQFADQHRAEAQHADGAEQLHLVDGRVSPADRVRVEHPRSDDREHEAEDRGEAGGRGEAAGVSQQILVPLPEVASLRRQSGTLLVIHGDIRLSAGSQRGGTFAHRPT